jgi:outer membrane protein OmpA-like peptidoglycan-associated protein
MMRKIFLYATLIATVGVTGVWAQNSQDQPQNEPQDQLDQSQAVPTERDRLPNGTVAIFKVQVVGYTAPAINYRNRESTHIGFAGTSLLPDLKGKATVDNKQGSARVQAEFKHLPDASVKFGPPYLTYVLWAITPDGRPTNLGEIIPSDDHDAKIDAAASLQTFALLVTAEPYFAVTRPSDMVVAENQVLSDTTGTIEQVNAKFQLLKRGSYTSNVASSEVTPFPINGKAPLDIYEAENAIRIAKWAGADQEAADTLNGAETDLQNAQAGEEHKGDKKEVMSNAREATQAAEDARLISLSKREAAHQAELRKQATEAQAQAQQAQAQAEQAQAQAQADAQARAQAEAAQQQAQAAQQQAQAAQQQAQEQAQQASQQAAQAQQQAQEVQQKAEQMRAQLLHQLNAILQTQDTSRGLVVRMSDVLFATSRYELKPDAKLALAKLAGVLQAYPGLKLTIDGYTDSTGTDEYNQTLSDKRAEAVRTFLVSQGVSPDSITAQGFGSANPIASNDTSQGRQMNRRVDMIVSGTAIGTAITPNQQSAEAAQSR